jgi:uncharacterized membrane protein YeaQ/YmgE (transglycosylase-associated protein family)
MRSFPATASGATLLHWKQQLAIARRDGIPPRAEAAQRRFASTERASLMETRTMMNLILWLVAGAVIGWLTACVMSERAGTLLSIVVGVVGAMIGSSLFGSSTINQTVVNMTALLVSFAGAIVLLAIVKLARRGIR